VPKYRYGEIEDKEPDRPSSPGSPGPTSAASLLTIEAAMMPGQGPHDGDRQPARRDEGVDLGGRPSYVRSRAVAFGIQAALVLAQRATSTSTCRKVRRRRMDPLPGVAMVTAIVSVMTGGSGAPRPRYDWRDHATRPRCGRSPVSRKKLIAALRGGIKTVLIPEENAKDLVENRGQHQEWARESFRFSRMGRGARPAR